VIFGSVCSGIEAASAAWHPLGWRAAFVSEIEAFPSAVLAHHYPDVRNLGDMTKFQEWPDAAIDVLVGGTPCQSFSVAGLRKGLADPRGNLMLTYLAIAARYRPEWLVWENVPGVLSSNGGRDFASFLRGLAELGYGFAYRILDAQYFGVPQRRRRVFVVGCAGSWQRAAAVLFERHSLQGNSAPSREAREGFAGRTARSVAIRGRDGTPQAELGDELANAILTPNGGRGGVGVGAILEQAPPVAMCLNAGAMGRQDAESETLIPIGGCFDVAHALCADGFDASEDGTGRGTPLVAVAHCDVMPTMMNGANTPAGHNARSGHSKDSYIVPVAFAENSRAELRLCGGDGQTAAQLTTGGGKPGQGQPCIAASSAVRRLTPRECERLQGFADDYTLIQVRGKPAADGPRYKALGNSMAVPVMRWIGERIALVAAIKANEVAA